MVTSVGMKQVIK